MVAQKGEGVNLGPATFEAITERFHKEWDIATGNQRDMLCRLSLQAELELWRARARAGDDLSMRYMALREQAEQRAREEADQKAQEVGRG